PPLRKAAWSLLSCNAPTAARQHCGSSAGVDLTPQPPSPTRRGGQWETSQPHEHQQDQTLAPPCPRRRGGLGGEVTQTATSRVNETQSPRRGEVSGAISCARMRPYALFFSPTLLDLSKSVRSPLTTAPSTTYLVLCSMSGSSY